MKSVNSQLRNCSNLIKMIFFQIEELYLITISIEFIIASSLIMITKVISILITRNTYIYEYIYLKFYKVIPSVNII